MHALAVWQCKLHAVREALVALAFEIPLIGFIFIGGHQALSAMVKLELPHVNVLTKMDICESKVRPSVCLCLLFSFACEKRAGSIQLKLLKDCT